MACLLHEIVLYVACSYLLCIALLLCYALYYMLCAIHTCCYMWCYSLFHAVICCTCNAQLWVICYTWTHSMCYACFMLYVVHVIYVTCNSLQTLASWAPSPRSRCCWPRQAISLPVSFPPLPALPAKVVLQDPRPGPLGVTGHSVTRPLRSGQPALSAGPSDWVAHSMGPLSQFAYPFTCWACSHF